MIKIDVLIRTNRKSISISITPTGNVVIKAPKTCPIEEIQNIVEKKENWINLHKTRILNNLELNNNIFSYRDILFFGQVYHIVFDSKVKHIKLENDYCVIPDKYQPNFTRVLIKWYKKIAIEILRGRVEYFSNLMQVSPKNLRLSNAKGCWGSCNSAGLISLNWRLIMLPHDIIDYVVVHELSHLLQMNHSNLFWQVVKSVLPDFSIRRKNLKKGDYLLNLFRE